MSAFFIAADQPRPPLWEWVKRMPGPMLSKSAETASGHDVHVKRTRIRCHRTEVLVQRFRIARELHSLEIVRPDPHSELTKPELLVRLRLDRCPDGAAAGVASTGLVDEIDREVAAQKDILKPFSTVRSRLPGLRELAKSVPHHDRVFPRRDRDLVERIEMIAVVGLPGRVQRLQGIERAGLGSDCPPDGEASLFLDHQRLRLADFLSHHACRRENSG
jgi:hypothetical protein